MLSPSDKNLKYKTNHNNKIMDIKMRKEYEKPQIELFIFTKDVLDVSLVLPEEDDNVASWGDIFGGGL